MTEQEHIGSVAMGDSRAMIGAYRKAKAEAQTWCGCYDSDENRHYIVKGNNIIWEKISEDYDAGHFAMMATLNDLRDAHALTAALAHPVQEPVAWRARDENEAPEYWHYFTKKPNSEEAGEVWEPLYAAPQPAHGTSATDPAPAVSDGPPPHNGCVCSCHRGSGIIHFVPCCSPSPAPTNGLYEAALDTIADLRAELADMEAQRERAEEDGNRLNNALSAAEAAPAPKVEGWRPTSCLKLRMMAGKLRKDDAESEFACLLEDAANDIERLSTTPAPNALAPVTAGQGVEAEEIDELVDRLLDAQQDINFAANCTMDQSLCDAAALIDDVESFLLRIRAALSTPTPKEESK